MLSAGQRGLEERPSPSALTPDVLSWLGDIRGWAGLSPDPRGPMHPCQRCHRGANLQGAAGSNWGQLGVEGKCFVPA